MKKTMFALLTILATHSAFAGVSSYLAWDKESIKVCFAGKGTEVKFPGVKNGFANWNEKQKSNIEDILTKEFTPERTGYHFVGFTDCEDGNNYDVIILRKPNYSPLALTVKGFASVGRSFAMPVKNFKTVRGLVVFTATGIGNYSTIVHEFSHILGLKHEHDHPDAREQAQSWCMDYTQDTTRQNFNIYTAFDEVSVMNYCQIRKDNRTGLSQGDVKLIRTLYKLSTIKDKREFN